MLVTKKIIWSGIKCKSREKYSTVNCWDGVQKTCAGLTGELLTSLKGLYILIKGSLEMFQMFLEPRYLMPDKQLLGQPE